MTFDLPVNYEEINQNTRRLVREQYVQEQGGLCHYCNTALSVRPEIDKKINLSLFPPNFLKYPIHLHHCHYTGMTIGAVHAYCNAVLWQYEGE